MGKSVKRSKIRTVSKETRKSKRVTSNKRKSVKRSIESWIASRELTEPVFGEEKPLRGIVSRDQYDEALMKKGFTYDEIDEFWQGFKPYGRGELRRKGNKYEIILTGDRSSSMGSNTVHGMENFSVNYRNID